MRGWDGMGWDGMWRTSSALVVCRLQVSQFLQLFSKTLSERTAAGARQTVQEKEYMCHAFTANNGLSGICIADAEYPSRVAFGLLSKVLDEFAAQYPSPPPTRTLIEGLHVVHAV